RHAQYYTEFAERALPHLRGPDQGIWLQRLDAESANLRGALDIATQRLNAELALRLVNALAWYWFLRGRLGEGNRSLVAALTIDGETTLADRAKAMAWRAGFALRAGDPTYSLEQCDAVFNLLEEVDDPHDPRGQATATWFLCFAQIGFGDQESCEKRVNRVLMISCGLGDRWG